MISRLVTWFKSMGLKCHAAHVLGNLIAIQHQKLRPAHQSIEPGALQLLEESLPNDIRMAFPNFISAEMLSTETEDSWPPWDGMT